MPFLSYNSNEENKKTREWVGEKKKTYNISNNHDYF